MVFIQFLGSPFLNTFSSWGLELRDGSSGVKSGHSGKGRWQRERLKGNASQKPIHLLRSSHSHNTRGYFSDLVVKSHADFGVST